MCREIVQHLAVSHDGLDEHIIAAAKQESLVGTLPGGHLVDALVKVQVMLHQPCRRLGGSG